MLCPQCGAMTEVVEKHGAYRDRRCRNADCRMDFTTCENVVVREDCGRGCARTLALHNESPRRAPSAGPVLAAGES